MSRSALSVNAAVIDPIYMDLVVALFVEAVVEMLPVHNLDYALYTAVA